ncbi:MAG: YraN family protein [Gammaproteobacteria bacterium]|nr:YraN family protein [Gammaproteobacteria bacterium]
MKKTWRRKRGDAAELRAEHFLHSAGLEFRDRNYHCRWGEIDLVMQDGNTLVFIEVRLRQNDRFGGATASVSPAKQQRLLRTASHYLAAHAASDTACRFDVVAESGETGRIDWIKNAFEAG